jgi:pimeloyl-ACP methyl ester carboxylesterase
VEQLNVVGRRRATLALAVALCITGCSSSSKAEAPPTTPATTVAATTTAEPATTAVPAMTATTATTATTAAPAATSAAASGIAMASPVGPAGDAFYTPPAGEPGKPGTLIWWRDFTAPTGTVGRTILYWSLSATGKPIPVSGVVLAPANGSAAAPNVIAWAHGTAGMGDQCAPSKAFASGTAPELQFAPLVTQTNAVFVATDYEGLGTSGDPAYLVGRSEGQGVLDAARAAQQLNVGVTAASGVLLWGHSQGGGAAAWAAELAPTYAPELRIVGAMLGAPAGELTFGSLSQATDAAQIGYALAAIAGLKAAYPELNVDDVLNAKGQELLAKVVTACGAAPIVAGVRGADLVTAGSVTAPGWADHIAANNPAQLTTPIPLFIYHGDADTTVPVGVSAAMQTKYCKLGVISQRKVYPGKGHVDVIPAALTDLLAFATMRWAGTPPPTNSCP